MFSFFKVNLLPLVSRWNHNIFLKTDSHLHSKIKQNTWVYLHKCKTGLEINWMSLTHFSPLFIGAIICLSFLKNICKNMQSKLGMCNHNATWRCEVVCHTQFWHQSWNSSCSLYSPFRFRVTNHVFITWIFFYAIMEDN